MTTRTIITIETDGLSGSQRTRMLVDIQSILFRHLETASERSQSAAVKHRIYSDREGEERITGAVRRLQLGNDHLGEVPFNGGDSDPEIWPWTIKEKHEFVAQPRFLIDFAEIPGHPPMGQPGAEIPLPASLVHDIRECDWCAHHPAVVAEAAKPKKEEPEEACLPTTEADDPEHGVAPVPAQDWVALADQVMAGAIVSTPSYIVSGDNIQFHASTSTQHATTAGVAYTNPHLAPHGSLTFQPLNDGDAALAEALGITDEDNGDD